jgi:hypothetical protein
MKSMMAAMAAISVCASLSAADPGGLEFAVKFRAGATAGNLKDDTHSNKLMGLGLGGSLKLAGGGALIGEIGFTYFGGGEYDAMRRSGTIYYNPAAPASTYNGSQVFVSVGSTADSRKNLLEGFDARFGYSNGLRANWSWQAGLTLDSLKSRQEVSGGLRPVYGPTPWVGNGTAVPGGYYEGLTATPSRTKMNLGAFAGLKSQIGDNFTLEFNLRSVGYSRVDWVPFTYSGRPATSTTTSRRGLGLELAFGLKL